MIGSRTPAALSPPPTRTTSSRRRKSAFIAPQHARGVKWRSLLGSVRRSGGRWRRLLGRRFGTLDGRGSDVASLCALKVEPGADQDGQEQQEERQILHRIAWTSLGAVVERSIGGCAHATHGSDGPS